jgi:outer membrane protein assembly factor BamB
MSSQIDRATLRERPLRRRFLQYSFRTLMLLTVAAAVGSLLLKRWSEDQGQEVMPEVWDVETGKNVKWHVRLGSLPYKVYPPFAVHAANSSPCIAGGKVFIGSTNAGWIKRFPVKKTGYLGTLLCFDAETGDFLWQHSNQKLASVHDWYLGVASTPHVEGDRLWYVNNRCEVVCLDTEGFRDGENDGPVRNEAVQSPQEADVVWKFDMIRRLGVFPCRITACTPAVSGNLLFINTSNGIDETAGGDVLKFIYGPEVVVPAPNAPNLLALDKRNGRVVWTDDSVGTNVLRGNWTSLTYAVLGGVPQVLFPGGDGWLYSFTPQGDGKGNGKLLWKFDCNPKTSKWEYGGNRNHFIAPAVTCDDLVYIAVGQELRNAGGDGHLWCIDPTRRGDVSPELVFNRKSADPTRPIPHKRVQACVPADGDFVRPNPNSALVWHYQGSDLNGDGKLQFEETFHTTTVQPAIKNGLLVIMDSGGIVHCVDARTGKAYWTHDMLADTSSSVLIVGEQIYVSHDSEMSIFQLSADPKVAMRSGAPLRTLNMGRSIFGTPVLSDNVLYVPTNYPPQLFAITEEANDNSAAGLGAGSSPNTDD